MYNGHYLFFGDTNMLFMLYGPDRAIIDPIDMNLEKDR
jgi:hypothetical protein